MLDGMRDGAAIALFVSFLSLFAAVSLSNLTPRASIADFNCRYDGAYGTRKFKAIKYRKA